jgi:hypothetical protein
MKFPIYGKIKNAPNKQPNGVLAGIPPHSLAKHHVAMFPMIFSTSFYINKGSSKLSQPLPNQNFPYIYVFPRIDFLTKLH